MARLNWSVVRLFLLVASVAAKCSEKEWVDPDTPPEACIKKDSTGAHLELVFSDEFNVDGRTFQDGDDPIWTAITGFANTNNQKNAYVDTQDYATTSDGKLVLKVDTAENVIEGNNANNDWFSIGKHEFSTPMLQTWNKFCFTEGVLEISAQFPGDGHQPGLWPGFWLMGNLGRATLEKSTDGIWPFSYNHCPKEQDKEANQDPGKRQKINRCRSTSWTDQYGLNHDQGRGAPEIDIIEAMPGNYFMNYANKSYCPKLQQEDYDKLSYNLPMYSTSLPIAPGFPNGADQRPIENDANGNNCVPRDWDKEWYAELKQGNNITYGEKSLPNYEYWGDYFEAIKLHTDSLSAVNPIDTDAFTKQHRYTLEWKAGDEGYLEFQMDGIKQFHIKASTLTQEHEVTKNNIAMGTMLGRMIPEEPAYIMFNIDVSPKWGWPPNSSWPLCYDCSNTTCFENKEAGWFQKLCDTLPTARYEIDWIRLWQRPNDNVSHTDCSPKKYPTQGWIESNRENFISQNMNEPLRPVFAGGANCGNDQDCGPSGHGSCKDNVCNCKGNWTGPRCLVKRVGASSICRSLEENVVGGAACFNNAKEACGRHGTCYKVEFSGGLPGTQYHKKGFGERTRVGGGDGRCGCESHWGGPTCNEQRTTRVKTCLSNSPHPSWSGRKLEDYIEKTCQQKPWFRIKPVELENACNDVLWKHSGKYADCGAWLRASLVAKAAPCPFYRNTWFWVVVIAAVFTLCCMPVLLKWGCRRLCRRCRRRDPEQRLIQNEAGIEA